MTTEEATNDLGVATVEESSQGKLWAIREITILSHWLDEFTMANSAIIMAIAILAIAADAMLASKLLGFSGFILGGVAIITALGIETQARTMLRRGKIAWDSGKIGTAIWWWVVTAPIAAMLFITVWMWFLEHTENVSESVALNQIGISYEQFTVWRAAIFVFLFVMSGVNYYLAPHKVQRKHTDVLRDMNQRLEMLPIEAKLAQAQAEAKAIRIQAAQRVDAARLRRGRAAGQGLFQGVNNVAEYQEPAQFPGNGYVAQSASYAPVSYGSAAPAPVLQLTSPRKPVNGSDDTLPPNGGGNGGKPRPRGRPRITVDQMLNTPSPVQPSPASGKLVSMSNSQRAQAVGFLKGWMLGMSQAIARGEVQEAPTGVDAHEYLMGMNLAPKTAATSRKWLNIAIAELRNEGHSIEWSQPAVATVG